MPFCGRTYPIRADCAPAMKPESDHAQRNRNRTMRLEFPTHLNIRQKVMAAFTLLVIVTGSVGAVSFNYLREIERKQHFVQIADDLSNFILEARRYEKNFLLYGYKEDLDQNRRYASLAAELLLKVFPQVKDFQGTPLLNGIARELSAYRDLMDRRAAEGKGASDEMLREHGKSMVDLSHSLVAFERERILTIVTSLKGQLLFSIGITILIGGLLIPVVSRKIIQPLRVIEKTTHRIAQGDFRPLPVLDTRDETQRVVEGFNRMITELEKRQEQLVQAKKLSSLGTLTSGIAHQLNNPLNNISTSCQILVEEFGQADPDFSLKMLTNIESEVRRARDIVRGLLEFSRVKEFCLAPVSLAQVVERSITLISSHIPPGIEISRQVPEDLFLNLDAQRMQQVFLNLIENAVHAIDPPGRIRIAAALDSSQNQVVVTVEDTGNGIPEEVKGHIFDPFFTTKKVGLGTGLGLSIAFGIIQKHQGAITVESKEGEGTRFTLLFPREMVC